MADHTTIDELSFRRIVGFACNQGFLFYLFYMGVNLSVEAGAFVFERIDFVTMLVFMVVGFAMLASVPEHQRNVLLSRPLLVVYAVAMAIASLYPYAPSPSLALSVCASALLGAASSYLLTAWGRSFVTIPVSVAIPEVFVGSLVAVLLCLLFSLASIPEVMLLMRVFPVASAAWIDPFRPSSERGGSSLDGDDSDSAVMLTLKISFGTLSFGMVQGLMEAFASQPGDPANPSYQIGMLFFAAFLVGALTLLLSDGFGKGDALDKSYRLAVYVMVAGALAIPLSARFGTAVVLAGYLGLEAVLICLFLVMAKISETDGVAAFTRGFMSLFAGEAAGVVLANVITWAVGAGQTPYVVVFLSGGLALLSYMFLFTERDFESLSKIVTDNDAFDRVCTTIVQQFGLSKREAEILPFALRGRTGVRIAEELSISKSTVDTHLRRIYGKAGVHGRQELIDLGESIRDVGR